MTVDPRAALDRLQAALEAHYQAVTTRRGEEETAVDDAYDVLADAFEVYEDTLLRATGESLPFFLGDEDGDDDDDDDDDGDDDDDDDDDDDTDFDEDDLSDDSERDGVDLDAVDLEDDDRA